MSGSFARDKGQRGERELAKRFIEIMERVETELGISGYSDQVKRNTLQSDRGGFDLVGIPLLAVECKRAETETILAWWKQACAQAGRGELPVLLWRPNRRPWQAMTYAALTDAYGRPLRYVEARMPAEDFFDYYAILYRQHLEQSK